MPSDRSKLLWQGLALLAVVLILKVTGSVVLGYRDYLPPNFNSDFLRGRESHFFDGYQWAFYTHIASGPVSLILGLVLISKRFRLRFPRWHRYLGRIQAACVLLVLTPSGLWMAWYAAAGPVAAVGFALLSLFTAACMALGWRSAVKRRFAEHRRWMWRGFLLLCSAVVLRVLGGFGTVVGINPDWYDPLIGWVSWTAPLATFEVYSLIRRRMQHALIRSALVTVNESKRGDIYGHRMPVT